MPERWSEKVAATWLATDSAAEMLEMPRKIAASVVSLHGEIKSVLDIASGPGTFLEAFLNHFPNAKGIWHDGSDVMLRQAKENLVKFVDRVTWHQCNMMEIPNSGIPAGIDVILTSRATHHLTKDELAQFYSDTSQLLNPGGWIINLDHVQLSEPWEDDFRTARKLVVKPKESSDGAEGHKHERKAPMLDDHMDTLKSLGFSHVQTGWQAFYTYLIIAKRQ